MSIVISIIITSIIVSSNISRMMLYVYARGHERAPRAEDVLEAAGVLLRGALVQAADVLGHHDARALEGLRNLLGWLRLGRLKIHLIKFSIAYII